MLGRLNKAFDKDRLIILASGLACSVLITVLYVTQPQFLKFIDLKIYDQMLKNTHAPKKTDIPVIVDLDEKTLQEYGQWPWPRYLVGNLLAILQQYGAKAIATDIIFAEPDRASPERIKSEIKKYTNVEIDFTNLPAALKNNDEFMAGILTNGPFVLGYDFHASKEDDELAPRQCTIKPGNFNFVYHDGGSSNELRFAHDFNTVICPLPILSDAAPGGGFITIGADEDGIFRRVPIVVRSNDKFYPSLALSAFMMATGIKSSLVKVGPAGIENIRVGPVTIPVDQAGRMTIHFRGPQKTFKYFSAGDVMKGVVPQKDLLGKIVFIGTSASGLKDIRNVPMDGAFPGVETHANIVDNFLAGDFISTPHWATGAQWMSAVFFGIVMALLLAWTSAAWLVLPVGALSWGIWAGTSYLFESTRLYVSPLYPLLSLVLTFILLTVIKFWREEQAKQFITGAFSHYLAPSVIEQIIDDPESLTLEGEEREVTIQFSDVRSFTSLSEKLTPTQVTDLLHDYLTPMTRIITEKSGTLDKFIGDAVMAFWNAPLEVPDHPRRAVEAAMDQLARLDELNIMFEEKFGFGIKVGIGIHSGKVRVGNMGSADLFDYTLIGDNVNLASRLEGLTKMYGQELIVSEVVKDAVGEPYIYMQLDSVRVKGKKEPVTIFTARTPEQYEKNREDIETYLKGHELYQERRFDEAKAFFETLLKKFEEHPLYKTYVERCESLAADPPGDDWDGVFTLTSK